jgi:hypothetical protein
MLSRVSDSFNQHPVVALPSYLVHFVCLVKMFSTILLVSAAATLAMIDIAMKSRRQMFLGIVSRCLFNNFFLAGLRRAIF